jgi:maltooligosyltrehalose synthase
MKLTRDVLHFRKAHSELFEKGDYRPVPVEGPLAEHCIAYRRTLNEEMIIVAAPRLMWGVHDWHDTNLELPVDRPFRNLFTGEEVNSTALRDVFREFPVAMLVQEGA